MSDNSNNPNTATTPAISFGNESLDMGKVNVQGSASLPVTATPVTSSSGVDEHGNKWNAAVGLWTSADGRYGWTGSEWAPYPVWTSFGIDPGFASTGVAVLSRMSTGEVMSRGVWFIETKRDGSAGVRAGMDDARRMREFWQGIRTLVEGFRPHVLGVEAYQTHQPEAIEKLKRSATRLMQLGVPSKRDAFIAQLSDDRTAKIWVESLAGVAAAVRDAEGWTPTGLGHAAKTIGVLWIAATVAFECGVPVYVYEPSQMKKAVTGSPQSSKEKVGLAVENRIVGLTQHVQSVTPHKQNHVHDAAGHALTALYEYEKWRAAYR